ncbi:Hypothetical predicted protein, partial [Marmota monax]
LCSAVRCPSAHGGDSSQASGSSSYSRCSPAQSTAQDRRSTHNWVSFGGLPGSSPDNHRTDWLRTSCFTVSAETRGPGQ